MLLFLLLPSCAHGLIVFERYQEPTCRTRMLPDAIPMLGINYAKYPFPWVGGAIALDPLGRFSVVNTTMVILGQNIDHVNGSCIDHIVFRYGRFRDISAPVVMTVARKENGPQQYVVDAYKCINHQQYYWYTFAYQISFDNATGCTDRYQAYLQRNNASIATCTYRPLPAPIVSNCVNYSDQVIPQCATQYACTCNPDADCVVTGSLFSIGAFSTNGGDYGVVDSVRVIDSNSLPPPKGTPPPTSSGSRRVVAAVWLFLFLTI